jgi:hypothetical protein
MEKFIAKNQKLFPKNKKKRWRISRFSILTYGYGAA